MYENVDVCLYEMCRLLENEIEEEKEACLSMPAIYETVPFGKGLKEYIDILGLSRILRAKRY